MELVIPAYSFDSHSTAWNISSKSAMQAAKSGQAGKIRCKNCHEPVTDKQQGIDQNGYHIHHGTNPAGCSFDFACYQEAPGCAVVGPTSREHSWFEGYSWQIAICGACGEHLGWLFVGECRFYGLIIDRLLGDDQLSA